MKGRWLGCAVLILGAAPSRAAEPSVTEIKAAVNRAVPLISRSMEEYTRHRDCFSCHHQAVPVLAVTIARERGFEVSAEAIEHQVEHTRADLKSALESYRTGGGQGGGVTRAGYALWAIDAGGGKHDDTTAAVLSFILRRDQEQDHWRSSSHRPPSEASEFTTTALGLRALKTFGSPAQESQIAARMKAVREWLARTSAKDTEERVFRLWGLKFAGAPDELVQAAARELAMTQRDDGGWAQLDDRASDAYATGSTLVALHLAGGTPTSDPAYRKGLDFLIGKQAEDGSWHVVSRSKPFQTYFESGFPYEKDQFISMAATSWSAAALSLACPTGEKRP